MKPVLLILFFGIIVITGCKKPSYHQLSDEDMTWLVYQNNEINTFTDGSGQSVRILVTLRTKAYNESSDKYNEFTAANFEQMNDTSAIDEGDSWGKLFIYKQDDDGLLVTLSWPHFPLREVPINHLPMTMATVDGIVYDDVIVVDATGLTDARFYIAKIWYSKSMGVIQYEHANGDIWTQSI